MAMTHRQRLRSLIAVLVIVSVGAMSTAIYYLYRVAFEQQTIRLEELARTQADLILASWHQSESLYADPSDPLAATIRQIKEAHEKSSGLGETGEFTLGRIEGGEIHFLLSRRFARESPDENVALDSGLAEPMRRALWGETGSLVGPDYRGATVLAAYQPIAEIGLGIVAKIDLEEIRRPYVQAGAVCGVILIILLGAGSSAILRIGNPLVDHLSGLNRLYQTLSQVNLVVTQAGDSDELLSRVCQVAVEHGDFKLAWVGFVDEAERLVKPVAHWGLDDGYLKGVNISLDPDDERSLGPTGQCILTEKTQVLNHYDETPRFRPWLVAASVRGFRSSGAFAIRRKGRPVGAFMVYSGEAGFFDEAEIELLEEAADSISLGLDRFNEAAHRRQAEEDRQASELSLVRAQSLGKVGSWHLDFQDGQMVWSDECQRILGLFDDPIDGVQDLSTSESGVENTTEGPTHDVWNEPSRSVHHEDRDAVRRLWQQALSGDAEYDIQYRVVVGDEVRWVRELAEVERDASGSPVAAVGTIQDVTTQKLATDMIEESGRHYRRIFETSPTLLWEEDFQGLFDYFDELRARGIQDLEEYLTKNPAELATCMNLVRVLDVNQAALELHNASSKDDLIQGIERTISESAYEVFKTELVSVWNGATEFESQAEVSTLDGEPRHVILRMSLDDQDSKQGLVSMTDITDRMHQQEQAARQDRLASVGQLAAGVAHDFNNMLSVMMGYAQVLGMEENLPVQMREDLETILTQGKRASDMIRRLLDFSRRSESERTVVDLKPFLKESSKLINQIIPENIRVSLETTEDPCMVMADTAQVQQIYTNIVVNARDAMANGGEFTVTLAREKIVTPIEGDSGAIEPGEWVVWKMADTGTGMAPEVFARAFEPFFTTKARGEGTGLGLAQVLGLVSQNGGQVILESRQGEYTRISIYFPFVSDLEDPVEDEMRPQWKDRSDTTILLVEDDESVRGTTGRLLSSLGYDVVTATDGANGLDVYKENADRIRIVVTDVVMPRMDGFEMAKELAELAPDLPLIKMTGYSDRIKDREPDDIILRKPVMLDDLVSALEQVQQS